MNYKIALGFSFVFIFISGGILSQAGKSTKSMNLHDFMEDYVEAAEKDFKRGKTEKLIQLLKYIPNLAPEQDKEEWKKIVDEHLNSDTPLKSCKSCHVQFKKSYKKTYRKKLLEIPTELLE
ncbi:MAG: hypothetical protein N3A69_17695 [Leptospiraceae bacterium]|nr:hypothetical protein [Leptospiraceae bacterium]